MATQTKNNMTPKAKAIQGSGREGSERLELFSTYVRDSRSQINFPSEDAGALVDGIRKVLAQRWVDWDARVIWVGTARRSASVVTRGHVLRMFVWSSSR
jgi:hypothetical protein